MLAVDSMLTVRNDVRFQIIDYLFRLFQLDIVLYFRAETVAIFIQHSGDALAFLSRRHAMHLK